MKYFYLFILGLLVISTCLSSCGDDGEPTKFTPSEGSYMLSRVPWLLTDKSINGEPALAKCYQDDSLFFMTAAGKDEEGNPNPNKFLLKPGPVPCENEASDSLNSGTWTLAVADNRTGLSLTMYRKSDTIIAAIDRITGHFLTLSYLTEEDQVQKEYIAAQEEEK